jgi:hypothetical protein
MGKKIQVKAEFVLAKKQIGADLHSIFYFSDTLPKFPTGHK